MKRIFFLVVSQMVSTFFAVWAALIVGRAYWNLTETPIPFWLYAGTGLGVYFLSVFLLTKAFEVES